MLGPSAWLGLNHLADLVKDTAACCNIAWLSILLCAARQHQQATLVGWAQNSFVVAGAESPRIKVQWRQRQVNVGIAPSMGFIYVLELSEVIENCIKNISSNFPDSSYSICLLHELIAPSSSADEMHFVGPST
jgi:hypothetical protein